MADDEVKYAQRKASQKPGAAKRPRKPRPVAVVLCNGNCELHGCEQGCVGCQACVNACRKGAISLNERGVACIACGACERACPAGAIHVVDNHAVIDYSACIACGMCATKCPRGVIRDAWGIVAQI